jgi:glycosyltransferase involved in cell wall biosynthesis
MPVELIVLDDGSTDGTRGVLERYGKRFHWETHANVGQAATLNKGWGMAGGEILGYLSADDVLAPQAARKAVAALTYNPHAVAAYPDFNLIDPHSAVVRTVRAPDFDFCRALLGTECLPGPGAFFRSGTLRKAGGWNTALKQMPDYDFWLRLGLHGEFIHLREVLAGFRVHPGSQTYGATTTERAAEPVAIISAILANAQLPGAASQLRETALANAHLFSAQLHLRAGRVLDGWREIRTAYRLQPRNVLSARFARLFLNAVFNRIGHRALWSARALFRHNGAPRS